MIPKPGWDVWESYVNETLGLSPTAGSGNQWYEKGDGIDRSDSEYAFQVESKYTEQAGFRVTKVVGDYARQAAMQGKKFALCLRIWAKGQKIPTDYAVIPFDVFVDLVQRAKEGEQLAQQQDDR
ncbi:holliday junction resolvase [Mycobacterium phage ScoobyDoobyDoo]|nr:holliday junction resolvase [Mycobacterium phage ScoobyDoobyDoo]